MKRIISIIIVAVLLLGCCACSKEDASIQEEDIHAICELASIKCYYNNVAELEKKADNIFQKDRKMWIEYEGEAVIGVKMDEVRIKISGETVTIDMPKAKILKITFNDKTFNQISSSDGVLFKNTITAEEQQAAIQKGQAEMKKAVEENKSLFIMAEEYAKELIANYINKIGKISQKEYHINWK